jgi:hypothetical protein
MDKNEELQKWLNDDRYVQIKELEIMWSIGRCGANSFLRRCKIKPVKILHTRQGLYAFYDKQQCINARTIHDARLQELLKCLNDTNLIQTKELDLNWGLAIGGAACLLSRKNIKPIKKINAGRANEGVFYDRAECERARPFINQPEPKEVEKVEEKQMELPEPKEQTPDIIPADTIDLFTMPELETELRQRGVELTAEVRAKINASDMPEMQHVATMLRGNAKSIAIRLSVLNEIAGELREVKPIKKVDLTKVNYFLRLQRERPKHFRLRRLINRIVKYKKFILEHEIHDICWNLAIKIADDRSAAHKIFHAALSYEQAFFWFTKGNHASGIGTFCLKDKKDLQKIVELNQDKVILTEEDRAFWYKRNFGADDNVFESNKSNLHSGSTWIKNMMGLVITDKIVQMAQKDGVSIPEKLRSIINAAWLMGNYENK